MSAQISNQDSRELMLQAFQVEQLCKRIDNRHPNWRLIREGPDSWSYDLGQGRTQHFATLVGACYGAFGENKKIYSIPRKPPDLQASLFNYTRSDKILRYRTVVLHSCPTHENARLTAKRILAESRALLRNWEISYAELVRDGKEGVDYVYHD